VADQATGCGKIGPVGASAEAKAFRKPENPPQSSQCRGNFRQASDVGAAYLWFEVHSLAIEPPPQDFAAVSTTGNQMYEPLISGGAVRKLWVGETELYRRHLLRLDAESRRNRFGGAVSDEFIRRYSEPSALNGAVIYGFFVEGVLRGAAELRLLARVGEGEAAISIERAWQSRGVGSTLLERVLLAARNRQIKRLHMTCLNFRCFADLNIADCRRVNVIVGDNGSGKTSLLEALFFALASSSELGAARIRPTFPKVSATPSSLWGAVSFRF
jgi:GNAT superfamily N-acetyltransferase